MIEFTKEEINLCKQIAEKCRKEIEYTDWYWSATHNEPLLAADGGFKIKEQKYHGVFKIWTIPDCLEWLKERYDDVDVGSIQGEWELQVHDAYDKVHHPEFLEDIRGKTPLETCLKAVLVVLEARK